MVRLEWAEIEAFDEASKPKLTEADLGSLGPDPQFELQPHIRLLDLQHPVDEMLLAIRHGQRENDIASNAVTDRPQRRRPPKAFLAETRADFSRSPSRRQFGVLQAARCGGVRHPLCDFATASDCPKPLNLSIGATAQAKKRPRTLQAWFALWSSLGWFCKPN